MVYDPYTTSETIVSISGISYNSSYHIPGIDYDVNAGYMYFSASGAQAFVTGENGLGGSNKLVKYDTIHQSIAHIADMANFQASVQTATGQAIGGFQDMAEDEYGNSRFVASYGNSIAKIDYNGAVTWFFYPSATTISDHTYGFTSLAAYCNYLVVADTGTSRLYRFDATASTPTQVPITLRGLAANTAFTFNAAYALPKQSDTMVQPC
jgi:hypothetical protein